MAGAPSSSATDDGTRAVVRAGSLEQLRHEGQLLTKVGSTPVVVVWHDGRAWAIEDRCPHMGFPLHQGSVESGLLTCHWHHARFDLESGCTLDPWADDAAAFDVRVDGDDVLVSSRPRGDAERHLGDRLREGLEQGLTLVIAKAVHGLMDVGADPVTIVRTGIEYGAVNREAGWGSGLTVLVAMANVFPHLDAGDRALALVHALRFVACDTNGEPPRRPLRPLETTDIPVERLAGWYRRFVDTRSPDAAERVLATALRAGRLDSVEGMLFAAATDHVFMDEGHTLDFTNKACEVVGHLGQDAAVLVLPTLVHQTSRADRAEESSPWRHPDDLVALLDGTQLVPGGGGFDGIAALAWQILDTDARGIVDALVDAAARGANAEQLGRGVAYAAALRLVRFHVRNEVGDWDQVHHAFTTANAVHQALLRNATPELLRGVVQAALRVHLDRFLNVPAARIPAATDGDLTDLASCFDSQGHVDRAGTVVVGYLRGGGDRGRMVAALGHALLAEDPGFHWYQVYEAGVRQALAWPEGSEEAALVLCGVARFLAAHTPTLRELPAVVRIAAQLRRGEALYEE